ncbi:MAG TPA: 16S rRNA (cytosine(1402)-N(4))-methyltransferase RsmH [Pseudomonadales bacterium]|nr:16S rRNA (cytosine(1402)-N(4))-methyltransferase RsmH [Pseudomonadales bacterium]
MEFAHATVLLQEAVDALLADVNGNARVDGIYVDGTFGRGGHSRLLLEKLGANGVLLGVDKDPAAIAVGEELAQRDPRFQIEAGSFAQLSEFVHARGWAGKLNGILLDLGVSSPQLDEAERGFSFTKDGPLDMRMNNQSGMTAADWINSAKERDIADVLFQFGEEKFARRIARAIVEKRVEEPIIRTLQLAKLVADANPSWEKNKHPATRSFQAIRIFINRELDDLQHLLAQTLDLLAVGGKLVVISFHSLEDRIVKQFMQKQQRGGDVPKDLPITADQLNIRLKIVGKPVYPGDEEIDANPRARSAVMRVAVKVS